MPSISVDRRAAAFAALVLLGYVSTARAQQPAVDVSGRWSLAIRTPDGEEPRTLDLAMAKDGRVTGSITAPLGTLEISAGVMSRDSLRIEFAMAGGLIAVTLSLIHI